MRADFLNHECAPERPAAEFDLASPARFFNRETSWLAFNWRVLEESENAGHPLLERVRFLSISGGNLDEFYMVRVAGLKGQQLQEIEEISIDGRTPSQQLEEIAGMADALTAEVGRTIRITLPEGVPGAGP